jgi:hypothetical protein
MKEHRIPCPKCRTPMRHRALSNLYWCPNCEKVPPPIKDIPIFRRDIPISQDMMKPEWYNSIGEVEVKQ